MENLYPAGPVAVPATLTQPTPAYRKQAWLAMGGLALFVAFYLALTGWLAWTAWRLLSGAFQGNDFSLWAALAGVCAAFLTVFMLKALVFVKHGHESDDIEVRREEEPRLFEFLHRLADEAGAPRPHRVFLSARVNAAVFYDLSILNLLYPSRKNLEVGLGLVNVLTLGELKAVLAHEFGHFAQKTMAVGRWVYVAQQIATHVIAKRDVLDRFLRGLSRIDLRIAWVGWLLSLTVWSIRSLMETVFRVVIIGERALSREMELQADLVAVSLTGSDALIHALHRLGVADQAWDRALGFLGAQLQHKRAVRDVFAVQKRIMEQMRIILGDPQYGNVPPVPGTDPHVHRVFRSELAQPPRMWATHPANAERESNAKRVYIAAAIDARSAWDLFSDAAALRERMSAHLARTVQAEPQALDESLKKLDEQYCRAFLDRSYRGAYLGRSVVRQAERVGDLYGVRPLSERLGEELTTLYPPSLADHLEEWRKLEEERASLQALSEGLLTAPGGVIRHGGRELKRHELPEVISALGDKIAAVSRRVNDHDRRCRTAHLTAAASLGAGWPEYLQGLLTILHYADHTETNLRDAQGFFGNVFAVVTADGKVSARELQRLLDAGRQLYTALEEVQDHAKSVALDRTLARRMNVESWRAALEELKFPPPAAENFNNWIANVDSWVESTAQSLAGLRLAALEQLLLAESQVARFVRERMRPGEAPPPSQAPAQYATMMPGKERPRQRKLGLWDRFQVADGLWATVARLSVAAAIVAGVFFAAGAVGESSVVIYNGLGTPVHVDIGGATATVPAFSHGELQTSPSRRYTVQAKTREGQMLESFDAETGGGFSRYVYNVASAAPLVEWTASYGNAPRRPDKPLGAPRWTTTTASVLFEEPPQQVRGERDNETRRVLTGLGDAYPPRALSLLETDAEREAALALHARWDDSRSRYAGYWVMMAQPLDNFAKIFAQRLAQNPRDVLNLRLEQDLASDAARTEVCARHTALATAAADTADLQYIATRCIVDERLRDAAFLDLQRRWPQHGWLAMAAGYVHAGQANWQEALPLMQAAYHKVPALSESLAVDIARVHRALTPGDSRPLAQFERGSEQLQYLRMLEAGDGSATGWGAAYHELAKGRLTHALDKAKRAKTDELRILRLAAASDGADEALVQRAVTLPLDQGIDDMTVWSALGLAVRARADTVPYAQRALDLDSRSDHRDTRAVLAFLDAIRNGSGAVAAERTLDGVLPHVRGQAYVAATVALGPQTPQQWRELAKRLLFAGERPYFL